MSGKNKSKTTVGELLGNPSFVRMMRSMNLTLASPCYEVLLSLEEPRSLVEMGEEEKEKLLPLLKSLEEAGLVRRKDNLYARTPLGDAFALAEYIKMTAALELAKGIEGKEELISRVKMLSRVWRVVSGKKGKLEGLSERIEGQTRVLSKEIDRLLRAIP